MSGAQIKRHLRSVCVGPDLVFLLGESEQFMLRGQLYAQLVPLLDGTRDDEALIRELGDKTSPAEVLFALATLRDRGYLAGEEASLSPEAVAFWQSLGVDPATAARNLSATPVSVDATGDIDTEVFTNALAEAGVCVDGERARAHLILTDDYLSHELDAINRRALRGSGRPWMLLKLTGGVPWIGPIFRPQVGFCWACLAHRVHANRPVERFIHSKIGGGSDGDGTPPPAPLAPLAPPSAKLAATERAAASLAAVLIARWIAEGQRGPLDRSLLTLSHAEPRITEHLVTRRPQCPACGDPGLTFRRSQQPLVIDSRPKRFTDEGGHRVASPEQTLEASFARLVSPITGIISGVALSRGSDSARRPVYGAVFPVCPRDDAPQLSDFRQSTSGKGRSLSQARVSALCEAVERWSGQFQGDEPRIKAKIGDLGDDAIHPRALLHYSDAQYSAREELRRAAEDPRNRVPEPFDPAHEIEWSVVWSLTHARSRYVPTAYCYNNYPHAPARAVFPNDSNGNAAGNCREEAIVQGFLELCERDAVALWWYSRSRRPGVDLGGFDEPYFQELADHYRSLGWTLWALDVTSDLGIPAFVALARGPDQRMIAGFGCHFEARLAVQRALTEINQLFLVDRVDVTARRWSPVSTEGYLLPDANAAPRRAADYPICATDDLRDDVLECVKRAAAVGLETLVLDQTRPDVELAAVKVIVPGLRHFWSRLGPGRLYDVPVRLGWRKEPLREEDLNPLPVFW